MSEAAAVRIKIITSIEFQSAATPNADQGFGEGRYRSELVHPKAKRIFEARDDRTDAMHWLMRSLADTLGSFKKSVQADIELNVPENLVPLLLILFDENGQARHDPSLVLSHPIEPLTSHLRMYQVFYYAAHGMNLSFRVNGKSLSDYTQEPPQKDSIHGNTDTPAVVNTPKLPFIRAGLPIIDQLPDTLIALDTETTGQSHKQNHRILEVGAVTFGRDTNAVIAPQPLHFFCNPKRSIDPRAVRVHGITWADVKDMPRFIEQADHLVNYVQGRCVVIHNATFDTGFLNAEFGHINRELGHKKYGQMEDYCTIVDSLKVARSMRGKSGNSMDDLCRDFGIDLSGRTLHGALKDAQLLALMFQQLVSVASE